MKKERNGRKVKRERVEKGTCKRKKKGKKKGKKRQRRNRKICSKKRMKKKGKYKNGNGKGLEINVCLLDLKGQSPGYIVPEAFYSFVFVWILRLNFPR